MQIFYQEYPLFLLDKFLKVFLALVGAGSVITKNVADDAIGISRATQKQIDDGAKAHRKKADQKKTGV